MSAPERDWVQLVEEGKDSVRFIALDVTPSQITWVVREWDTGGSSKMVNCGNLKVTPSPQKR